MSIADYVSRIRTIASRARSESKLEGGVNQILKECLAEFGIDFDPHVNETLKSLGLSQVDSDRPDGVFGHVVFDYKRPGRLSNPSDLQQAKSKLEEYLDTITGGHGAHATECLAWFGYLIDGLSLTYCRSNGSDWLWSRLMPLTESTLLFLVHAYRSLQRKPLSAELLSDAFGKDAEVAKELIGVMCSHLAKPRHRTNMLFREWRRLFEQVSTYALDQLPSLKKWAVENGIATKNASHILFAIHTYYSLVVKLLTSELLSISAHIPSSVCEDITGARTNGDLYSVLGRIENAEYYRRYRISNFLEGDFFSWYMNERSVALADAIRAVAREFLHFEPASAILVPEAKQDLLKQFYTSLVDEQIRHDLGEYYTPDWLAQHLLDTAGYHGDPDDNVLDPACGSGTFLVEAIARLKQACAEKGMDAAETLRTILSNVKGLDLNPLAVISARANYILSIHDLVLEVGADIELPVYLADSINVPVQKRDLCGDHFLEYTLDTEIEQFTLEIPRELVEAQVLGRVLLHCEDAVERAFDFERFLRVIRRDVTIRNLLRDSVVARLRDFYETIQSLQTRDWNKIWCRIIKNNFSACGFGRFQYVLGNPPWVRWSRLPESYRDRVKAFCNYYGLVSGRGYSGGIESDISTVIAFSAADNWLKDEGTMAFLITWTVFKSASARGFRLSKLPGDAGLKIERIEDMTSLQAFPDASNETALYVARRVRPASSARFSKTRCRVWRPVKGRSRIPPLEPLSEVYKSCDLLEGAACPVGEWGSPLFTGSEHEFNACAFLRGSSDYARVAHRGTISDCARVFWVKLLKYAPKTNRALIRTLTEEELPRARHVSPVEGAWIEAEVLYPLVRGRDVGRYSVTTRDWYQVVPNDHYENAETEEDFADRCPLTYSYFKNFEDLLSKRSTYKRYQSHLPFYVIYCIGEYSFAPYKVVWLEQQNPAFFRASVISEFAHSQLANRLLIPDHKLYFAALRSPEEAHYLCAFLNSTPVRTWLGGFLLGKQIGTTIFEYMNVPKFDAGNEHCRSLVDASVRAHDERVDHRKADCLAPDAEKVIARDVRALCSEP